MTGPRPGMPEPLPPTYELQSRPNAHSAQGPNPVMPGGGIADRGARLQVFPWYVSQSSGAVNWSAQSLSFTAAANTTTVIPTFTFTVPTDNLAVVKIIIMTVQGPTAAMDLRWTLLKNNAPIQGWTGIIVPAIAQSGILIPYSDVDIKMSQGETLTAQVANATAAAATFVCTFQAQGWFVTTAEVNRLQAGLSI